MNQDPEALSIMVGEEDYMLQDGDAGKQLAIYIPPAEGEVQVEPPRPSSVVGTFVVQCGKCFRWRNVPTEEKYEEIRAHMMEKAFVCETALEWRADISCEAPSDISIDGSRLWTLDRPDIPQPPTGWRRFLKIRHPGATRFVDVYYSAPQGKKLRSMAEVRKYLAEHPEYTEAGVQPFQFDFRAPKLLHKNYVTKRPRKKATPDPNAGTSPSPGPNARESTLSAVPLLCWDPEENKFFLPDEKGFCASHAESSSRPKSRPKKIAKRS